MSDQNLEFLNKFISLYQDLIAHDGFSDMEVTIRLVKRNKKEVCLKCGREYRFPIIVPEGKADWKAYRAVEVVPDRGGYRGAERRSGKDRRDYSRNRRRVNLPRDFKLERRKLTDRRLNRGRRSAD